MPYNNSKQICYEYLLSMTLYNKRLKMPLCNQTLRMSV